MKVTVLVAVYNTEKYLPECLDSLLAQTHTDLEIMCVDDCSTDSSLSILRDYASRDPRIKIIALPHNQGQAKARNIAIKQSTGDLYCFLDSDDWFAPDSIEKCVQVFENNDKADCVLFKLIKVDTEKRNFRISNSLNHEQPNKNSSEIPRFQDSKIQVSQFSGPSAFRLSLDWSLHGVYMTTAALQKSILYDDTCRSYSDDNTTRLHYLRSREVCLSDGIYYYRQNPESVSHVSNISRFNFLRANEHMQQMLRDMNMPDDILNLHEQVRHQNLIGCYLFFCQHRNHWSKGDCEYANNEMQRIWDTIESARLDNKKNHRFGYRHCTSWFLFKIQEELFYFIRKIIK